MGSQLSPVAMQMMYWAACFAMAFQVAASPQQTQATRKEMSLL
jgi:hypothetical protein